MTAKKNTDKLPEGSTDPESASDESETGSVPDADDTVSGATDTDRSEGPVGIPHWNALRDIFRVLPCQVNPVNSKDWYTVVSVHFAENSTEIVLVTSDGEELRGRDIGDPVLVRTNDPDAHLLH